MADDELLKLASPIIVPINRAMADQAAKFTLDEFGNVVRRVGTEGVDEGLSFADVVHYGTAIKRNVE